MSKDIYDLMQDFEEYRDAETIKSELERKAYVFAKKAHESQLRDEGTPYFEHIERVAMIVKDEFNEPQLTTIALLHDVVEDTKYTLEDVKNNFSNYIAYCVGLLTKTNKSLEDYFQELEKNYQVLRIKIIDRYDNLRSLKLTPKKDKIERYISETEKYFYPIFERNIDDDFFKEYKSKYIKIIEEYKNELRR